MDTLIVATGNRGKLEEIRALLATLPIRVVALAEALPDLPAVVEDGATFAENAIKKAHAGARATMMLTLADDSGLEVDALGGRPGVGSARFAHDRATDAENNAALLSALAVPAPGGTGDGGARPTGRDKRDERDKETDDGFRARFRCVLALVDPFTGGGEPRTAEGTCEGAVTRVPRGSGGFGYDPLFVVAGTNRTMAELAGDEKNRLSHRARAFAALRPLLVAVLGERTAQVARLG